MYSFGNKSQQELNTCHKDIQRILNEVIKFYDFSVNEGLRSQERQQKLFREGKSHLDGINKKSKHQGQYDDEGNFVSFAVDIVPYKKGYNPWEETELNLRRFYVLMGRVQQSADELFANGEIQHKIRCGIDWDNDDIYSDQNFHDMPHFELI